jgi:hypothetical protein
VTECPEPRRPADEPDTDPGGDTGDNPDAGTQPVIPWPRREDTPLDIARAIAHDYRREVLRLDPDLCHRMDAAAHRLGQGWVAPRAATLDLDARLTAVDMSRYLHGDITADQIRQWGARHARGGNGIPRYTDDNGHTVYAVRDILDLLANRRRARADRKG